MNSKLFDLFKEEIVWHRTKEEIKIFYAVHNNEKIYLRINNFPEEIMYTIRVGDMIEDLEDLSENWSIDYSYPNSGL